MDALVKFASKGLAPPNSLRFCLAPTLSGFEACCDLGCGKFDTAVSGGDSVDFVHDY
jgi:hypothetical protein